MEKLACCVSLFWALTTSVVIAQPLFSAVAPSSRAVRDGEWATAFMIVANASDRDVSNCGLVTSTSSDNGPLFEWRLLQNQVPVGPVNPTFSIGPGSSTDLLVSASDGSSQHKLGLRAECDEGVSSTVYDGVNTFDVSFDNLAPDVIPVIATPSGDGVIRFNPQTRTAIFSLAAVVIDGSGFFDLDGIMVGFPDTPSVRTRICETTIDGVCLSPRSESLRVFLNQIPRYFSFLIEIEDGYYSPFFPEISRYQVRMQDIEIFSYTYVSAAVNLPVDDGDLPIIPLPGRYATISRQSDDLEGNAIETGVLLISTGAAEGGLFSLQGTVGSREFSFTFNESHWSPAGCSEDPDQISVCRFVLLGDGVISPSGSDSAIQASISCRLGFAGGLRCRTSADTSTSTPILIITGSLLPNNE